MNNKILTNKNYLKEQILGRMPTNGEGFMTFIYVLLFLENAMIFKSRPLAIRVRKLTQCVIEYQLYSYELTVYTFRYVVDSLNVSSVVIHSMFSIDPQQTY